MQRPRDRSVFLLIAILSALTTIITYRLKPDFLTGVDLKALDAMFKARGASEAPQEVVIVAVDEKSVNEQGRWPWPRQKTARVLTKLRQARVTVVDMVFS
ncbi:MAG: CHASE2 domain-containing protein, partial [Deltaproteobacteria bacterium]|nr:CHASE2 domain-containing protein [Deltaproteobacteria bacterium]